MAGAYDIRMSRKEFAIKNEKLTSEQLAEYRKELAAMDGPMLVIEYQAWHNVCRSVSHLPSPEAIQRFVQAWKELRKRRARR